MQTTRFTRLPGMILAGMLTLLVGQGLVFGHDDGDRREGTIEGKYLAESSLVFWLKLCGVDSALSAVYRHA